MRLRNLLLSVAAVLGVGGTSVMVSALGPDDSLTAPASVIRQADRLAAPADPLPDRPRVFMAFHGAKRLADTARFDSQWTYVQDNLDGLWGNNAAISRDQIARLTRKVETRRLHTESFLNGSSFFVETYDYVERAHPDIEFEREAITFYSDRPQVWNGRTIADARRAVQRADDAGSSPYQDVLTGWQPQNFYPNGEGSRAPITPGSSAERALLAGDGIFVECPNDVCNGVVYEDGFFRAMRLARQNDQQFVWLASRPPGSPQAGWLREFQTMYNRVESEGLWRPGDIVVLIAYDGDYPMVPERDADGHAADTLTGLAYWALKQ